MKLTCDGVQPTAVGELAWILDLLVQTANYAEPALEELDGSLLPGIAAMRAPVRSRYAQLWDDALSGCPELLLVAAESESLGDQDLRRLTTCLSTAPHVRSARRLELRSEEPSLRRKVTRRLGRLDREIRLRRAYRDLLNEIWDLAGPAWRRRGQSVALRAAADWKRRLAQVTGWAGVARLMPPRHPLTHEEQLAAIHRRRRFVVTPLYFCMSGGDARDLGQEVLIAVPASAHEPVRRTRDAAYVASRMRLLAEPTRVHILIHLLSAEAGIMEITRALKMSQPTVSEHVRLLARAGLVRARRRRGRMVYSSSWTQLQRVIEDARGSLARWTLPESNEGARP